jgi:ribosome-binding factor A
VGKLRVAKLEEAIKQEISSIIQRDLKDPRIGFISIPRVVVSGDLRHATVYVSTLGSEEERDKSLVGLQRATGFLRSELGRRIRLRYTPELTFQLDKSIAYAIELSNFIDQLREGAESDDHTPSAGDKKDPQGER